MCRGLRCWLERLVHISPKQGPKLSPLRVPAASNSRRLYSCHPIGEEESIASEETLGQYTLLQESTQRPRIRHGTERDTHCTSHGRRERESPQTSGRNVQAWSIRASNSLSNGRQGQVTHSHDCDKRTHEEGS